MIPHKIHQIWLGKSTIPLFFNKLTESWKLENVTWKHILWDDSKALEFIRNEFPHIQQIYLNLQYNIQRVDLLKYLILYKFGGVYLDVDYEPLKPIEPILQNQNLCLGLEPKQYSDFHNTDFFIGNAFMATIPKHDFFLQLINNKCLDKIN